MGSDDTHERRPVEGRAWRRWSAIASPTSAGRGSRSRRGPDSNYSLFTWQVPSTAAGNMAVTATATATISQQGTIGIIWTGLTAATRYLGAVRCTDGTTELDRTLVAVAT